MSTGVSRGNGSNGTTEETEMLRARTQPTMKEKRRPNGCDFCPKTS